MANYLLFIYPIALLVILNLNAKVCKKGDFLEDCWSRADSKYLQAAAAIGIILHHLSQLITGYGKIDKGPIVIMNSMGILFTSIFFFYSGYGLMVSLINKEDYLNGFMYKRLVPILIPFMLTNLIYVPISGIAEYRITNLLAALTSILGITLINTNAWFIIEILILYTVFYLCFRHMKEKKTALISVTLFTLVLIICCLLLGHDNTNLNGHWFKGEWWYNSTILFPAGLFVGLNRNKITDFIKNKYRLMLPVSIILFLIIFAIEEIILNWFGYYKATYTYNGYAEATLTLVAQILANISFIWMILVITMKIRFGNVILRKLCTFSLEIYLVQDLFFTGYRDGYILPEPVLYFIIIALSIGGGYVLHLICEYIFGLIEELRTGKLKTAESIEGKIINKRKMTAIIAVAVFYAIVTVLFLICGTMNIYDRTIGREKMIEQELSAARTASVGDELLFGHFDTNHLIDGDERLEWIVLSSDEEKVLLISKYVLFPNPYINKYEAVTYDSSSIRKLLINEGFYELFYKSERKAMGKDDTTGDNVFLLTPAAAEALFSDNAARQALGTSVAKNWGVNVDAQDKHTYWWLYGENESIKAPIVTSEGQIIENGEYVNRPAGGVRPAIIIMK